MICPDCWIARPDPGIRALLGLLGEGRAIGLARFADGDVLCNNGDVALEGDEVAAGLLVVLPGGEGDVAFEGAEGAGGGGARRGKHQGEQEETAMVAHDLALFGLLLGFHGQLEKWANFGVDRGRESVV